MNPTNAILWDVINLKAYSDVTSGVVALQIGSRLPSLNCLGSDIFLTALEFVNISRSKFLTEQVILRWAQKTVEFNYSRSSQQCFNTKLQLYEGKIWTMLHDIRHVDLFG